MSATRIEDRGEGHFAVLGELCFDSVTPLLRKSREQLKGARRLSFDLAGVSQVDSAGLALLIEWMRWARADNQVIGFENLPEQLLALARISDIDELLTTTLPQQPAVDGPV